MTLQFYATILAHQDKTECIRGFTKALANRISCLGIYVCFVHFRGVALKHPNKLQITIHYFTLLGDNSDF